MSIRLLLPLLALACSPSGSPVKVLVVTDGAIDPTVDAALARKVADGLAELGFQATGGDPLDGGDVRKQMARADAASAVVLGLSTEAERPGLLQGTHLHEVRLDATAFSDDGSSATHRLLWAAEDLSAGNVERRVTDTWVRGTVGWAADALYQTEPLHEALEGDVSLAELEYASDLRKYRYGVDERHEVAAGYQEYCATQAEYVADMQKIDGVACFGNPCGQYTLIGVDRHDRAIVQDISRTLLFPVPTKVDPYWAEPPERVVAIPLADTAVEQSVWRATNLYGFARLAPGADAAAVESFNSEGHTGVYGFSLTTGARGALSMLGRSEESRFVRTSPDGGQVLVCLSHGGCFTDDGLGRKEAPDYRTAWWFDAGLVGQLRTGELVSGDAVARHKGEAQLLGPVGDAIRLITQSGGRCFLDDLDPKTARTTRIGELPCIDDPSVLPDGRIVGTTVATSPGDTPGDAEVVLWDPSAQALVPLTTGSFREEYAFPTRDGTRVVFNRRLDAPPAQYDTRIHRRVVCVADVP